MHEKIVAISRWPLLRIAFRGLRLHHLYNAWLGRFPRTKTLPGSGIVYRSKRTESVSLALEILEGGNCYDPSLFPKDFVTFADLGCNVGYFTCWLAHHAKGRPIKGIMVDANAGVVAEARWHMEANKLTDAHVLQGVVGVNGQEKTADFYLYNEADTCSTAQLVEIQMDFRDKFKKITVPVIRFGEEWQRRFGDARCHLLKVDIEGSEMVFLQAETGFLRLVDVILVEWHKYRVSFKELHDFLLGQGFKFEKVIEDMGLNGTACFKRA